MSRLGLCLPWQHGQLAYLDDPLPMVPSRVALRVFADSCLRNLQLNFDSTGYSLLLTASRQVSIVTCYKVSLVKHQVSPATGEVSVVNQILQ